MILEKYPDYKHLNQILLPLIKSQQELFTGSQLAMGSGWTGPKTLFGYPETTDLKAFIMRYLPTPGPFTLVGWANIMGPGDYIKSHDHVMEGNQYWGVYYLTGAVIKVQTRLIMAPGDLLIYPAYMIHEVEPVTQHRVSIAFNCLK